MRQAIITRYFGPTGTRMARIKATAQAGSIFVTWDHGLNEAQNHTAAAEALARKFGWDGTYDGGGTKAGYVFVQRDCGGFVIAR